MQDLQNSERLRPLCELANGEIRVGVAMESRDEQDPPEYRRPEDSGDEVVQNQVVGLGR